MIIFILSLLFNIYAALPPSTGLGALVVNLKMKSSHRPSPNVVTGATDTCLKLLGMDAVDVLVVVTYILE